MRADSGIGTSRMPSERQSMRSAMALARRSHRQLIHDAARDARELVLGDLRELRRRPWFPRQVRRRRQRARHCNFERRGRGQAGANRYVSGNGKVGAAKREPGAQHRPRNPGDITEPAAASAAPGLAGRPLRQGVERDLPPFARTPANRRAAGDPGAARMPRRHDDRWPSAARSRRCSRCARQSG